MLFYQEKCKKHSFTRLVILKLYESPHHHLIFVLSDLLAFEFVEGSSMGRTCYIFGKV